MKPTPWTLRARWIFPVDGPPLPNGTLTVAGERILAVEPAGRRTPELDLGEVAVLPGLVNAHTHLDLGELRGRLAPPKDFAAWLQAVVDYRRASSPASWQAAVLAGANESLLHGTTLVGDIAANGLSAAILAGGPVRSTVFHELIGLTRQRARQTWHEARSWLKQHKNTPWRKLGLSPHASYSVRRGLFRLVARECRRHALPIAVHLGEFDQESSLLATHDGPLRSFLVDLGAWDGCGLAPSINWILEQLSGTPSLAVIHGNYLRSVPNATVVYCPRTHANFGHPIHPFRSFLAAGASVCLGTDSLASNPDLSILAEMRFLHQAHPNVEGWSILRMATLAGAETLGWGADAGSLTPGKYADLATVPLPKPEQADPHLLILRSDQPVRDVCFGGRWIIRAGRRANG